MLYDCTSTRTVVQQLLGTLRSSGGTFLLTPHTQRQTTMASVLSYNVVVSSMVGNRRHHTEILSTVLLRSESIHDKCTIDRHQKYKYSDAAHMEYRHTAQGTEMCDCHDSTDGDNQCSNVLTTPSATTCSTAYDTYFDDRFEFVDDENFEPDSSSSCTQEEDGDNSHSPHQSQNDLLVRLQSDETEDLIVRRRITPGARHGWPAGGHPSKHQRHMNLEVEKTVHFPHENPTRRFCDQPAFTSQIGTVDIGMTQTTAMASDQERRSPHSPIPGTPGCPNDQDYLFRIPDPRHPIVPERDSHSAACEAASYPGFETGDARSRTAMGTVAIPHKPEPATWKMSNEYEELDCEEAKLIQDADLIALMERTLRETDIASLDFVHAHQSIDEDDESDDGLAEEMTRDLHDCLHCEEVGLISDDQLKMMIGMTVWETDMDRLDYIDAHYYSPYYEDLDDGMSEELENLSLVTERIKEELEQLELEQYGLVDREISIDALHDKLSRLQYSFISIMSLHFPIRDKPVKSFRHFWSHRVRIHRPGSSMPKTLSDSHHNLLDFTMGSLMESSSSESFDENYSVKCAGPLPPGVTFAAESLKFAAEVGAYLLQTDTHPIPCKILTPRSSKVMTDQRIFESQDRSPPTSFCNRLEENDPNTRWNGIFDRALPSSGGCEKKGTKHYEKTTRTIGLFDMLSNSLPHSFEGIHQIQNSVKGSFAKVGAILLRAEPNSHRTKDDERESIEISSQIQLLRSAKRDSNLERIQADEALFSLLGCNAKQAPHSINGNLRISTPYNDHGSFFPVDVNSEEIQAEARLPHHVVTVAHCCSPEVDGRSHCEFLDASCKQLPKLAHFRTGNSGDTNTKQTQAKALLSHSVDKVASSGSPGVDGRNHCQILDASCKQQVPELAPFGTGEPGVGNAILGVSSVNHLELLGADNVGSKYETRDHIHMGRYSKQRSVSSLGTFADSTEMPLEITYRSDQVSVDSEMSPITYRDMAFERQEEHFFRLSHLLDCDIEIDRPRESTLDFVDSGGPGGRSRLSSIGSVSSRLSSLCDATDPILKALGVALEPPSFDENPDIAAVSCDSSFGTSPILENAACLFDPFTKSTDSAPFLGSPKLELQKEMLEQVYSSSMTEGADGETELTGVVHADFVETITSRCWNQRLDRSHSPRLQGQCYPEDPSSNEHIPSDQRLSKLRELPKEDSVEQSEGLTLEKGSIQAFLPDDLLAPKKFQPESPNFEASNLVEILCENGGPKSHDASMSRPARPSKLPSPFHLEPSHSGISPMAPSPFSTQEDNDHSQKNLFNDYDVPGAGSSEQDPKSRKELQASHTQIGHYHGIKSGQSKNHSQQDVPHGCYTVEQRREGIESLVVTDESNTDGRKSFSQRESTSQAYDDMVEAMSEFQHHERERLREVAAQEIRKLCISDSVGKYEVALKSDGPVSYMQTRYGSPQPQVVEFTEPYPLGTYEFNEKCLLFDEQETAQLARDDYTETEWVEGFELELQISDQSSLTFQNDVHSGGFLDMRQGSSDFSDNSGSGECISVSTHCRYEFEDLNEQFEITLQDQPALSGLPSSEGDVIENTGFESQPMEKRQADEATPEGDDGSSFVRCTKSYPQLGHGEDSNLHEIVLVVEGDAEARDTAMSIDHPAALAPLPFHDDMRITIENPDNMVGIIAKEFAVEMEMCTGNRDSERDEEFADDKGVGPHVVVEPDDLGIEVELGERMGPEEVFQDYPDAFFCDSVDCSPTNLLCGTDLLGGILDNYDPPNKPDCAKVSRGSKGKSMSLPKASFGDSVDWSPTNMLCGTDLLCGALGNYDLPDKPDCTKVSRGSKGKRVSYPKASCGDPVDCSSTNVLCGAVDDYDPPNFPDCVKAGGRSKGGRIASVGPNLSGTDKVSSFQMMRSYFGAREPPKSAQDLESLGTASFSSHSDDEVSQETDRMNPSSGDGTLDIDLDFPSSISWLFPQGNQKDESQRPMDAPHRRMHWHDKGYRWLFYRR